MVPVFERGRAFLQKRSDARHIAGIRRREVLVEQRLGELTTGLNISERILFSTAYRLSRKVATTSDYELTESLDQNDAGLGLRTLLAGLAKEGQELTPNILWTWVPGMDPNPSKRPEIRFPSENPAGIVVVDFTKSKTTHLIPKVA